jgi:hypothetical protein
MVGSGSAARQLAKRDRVLAKPVGVKAVFIQQNVLPMLSATSKGTLPFPRSNASRPVRPSSSPCGCTKKR